MNPVGRMMKRYISMKLKKALPLLFIGALVLSATTGCTTKEKPQLVANTSDQQTTTNPISITIKEAGTSMRIANLYTPGSGNKYVLYNATVKNNNAKDLGINHWDWQLITSNNKFYDLAAPSGDPSLNGLIYVALNKTQPGDVVSGLLVFEIPQNATPKSILFHDGSIKVTTNL